MQSLGEKVDALIAWGDIVDKKLRRLEQTLALLEREIYDLYARLKR